MSNTTQRWKKRVNVFRYIFSVNMNEKLTLKDIQKDIFENQNFDKEQTKILEYCFSNHHKIIELISKNLSSGWTWSRLPEVDRAILMAAYAESKSLGTNKKIIVDQSIITAKHFADINAFKYINAILDRIIE